MIEPSDWMSKARDDLRAAELLFEKADAAPLAVVGFLCQQAVEKALKAILEHRNVDPPRTHDLSLLADLLEDVGEEPPMDARDADRLSPFAVEMRYPSDIAANPTVDDIAHLVTIARKVIDYATGRVA